jgi:hypothetical protein
MNLPNYFIADLPSEAVLGPGMLAEACRTLKRNRELYLIDRPTESIIHALDEVGQKWMDPGYPLRHMAMELGPKALGFSRPTLERGLNSFFSLLTRENLWDLVEQDLGHAERMDGMVATEAESRRDRASMVTGPELLVQFAAGNIPNSTLMNLVLGLLARSAQFIKCGRGTSLLPRLFAHSIYETEHKLGACIELAEWTGGTEMLEEVVFSEADCVTATGGDEALASIRRRLPQRVRFLGYGHRVSFGLVLREALAGNGADRVAAAAARDVTAWNQLGCLSPHVVYVEHGRGNIGEVFASRLAGELEKAEAGEPRGTLPPETAAIISSRRACYEIRAAHHPDTRMWHSQGSTAWTVVYENDPLFQTSCLNRFVYVKEIDGLEQLFAAAEVVRGHVSTVGLAAAGMRAKDTVAALARWGASRVCPLGRMQEPPLTWRHDGRPNLCDLVTWTDWER